MSKKKIIETKEEPVIFSGATFSLDEKATSISPLSASFTSEDMNKVVEKINEIIAHINSVL